jgi:iron complex outermembrane receptor protein
MAFALCAAGMSLGTGARAEESEATLPTVTVSAQEDALAPTSGYSARSSRAATKTDTPLNETAQSVSVVTRQQIEDQQPQTVSQALGYTPGVYNAAIGSSTRYDYIVLRGFNGGMSVNEWLDGLRLLGDGEAYNALQIDPYALERIEVIRGPDSVFYGQSSPGGLVALQSKRPLDTPLHQIELGVGSNNRRWAALDFTGPVDGRSDLDYRLIAKADAGDAQQSLSRSERYLLAPSLSWRIDGRNRLLLQAYLQNDPDTGYHGSVPYYGSAVARQGMTIPSSFDDGSPGDGMSRQEQLYGYQFEHDFNDNWQFRQNARFQKSRITMQQVYQTGWTSVSANTLGRSAIAGQEHGDGYAIDNQVQGKFATGPVNHTLLAGLDAYRMQNDGYKVYGTASAIDPYAPSYANENITFATPSYFSHRVEQAGVYLNDVLALDQWRLSLGVREDHAEITSATVGASSQASWSGDKTTRRLGLSYVATNGLTPYFNYSEGFDPSASYYTDASGKVLNPQTSKQKEIGLKFQPANSATQLSAALYDLRQENVAYYDTATLSYQPVGTVRSRGVELEAKTKFGRRLSLMASLSANQMRILSGSNVDNTPFGSPARMASLWTEYAFDSGFTAGAGARYIGPQWADDANTIQLPSVTLFDLSLRYELGRFDPSLKGASVRLTANNLFNRSYVASCYNSLVYCYYGSARNLTAAVSYQW